MVTDFGTKYQARSFAAALRRRALDSSTWLCVGLDPDPSKLPAGLPPTPDGVIRFCKDLVYATAPFAACFKINVAFFEAMGPEGARALRDVRWLIPEDIPVIADAKRGDIGNTSAAYATALLDVLHFDAVTVNPYLGWDALAPFFACTGKGVFVLVRTSNPGSGALQELKVDEEPLFLRVAREALQQESRADIGLVVGATFPRALRAVRQLNDDAMFLVPGVGAQGASAREAVAAGANASGHNALINVSRDIMYASTGDDFAEAAAHAAERLASETWPGGKSMNGHH